MGDWLNIGNAGGRIERFFDPKNTKNPMWEQASQLPH
jgi:hypothetical protein